MYKDEMFKKKIQKYQQGVHFVFLCYKDQAGHVKTEKCFGLGLQRSGRYSILQWHREPRIHHLHSERPGGQNERSIRGLTKCENVLI